MDRLITWLHMGVYESVYKWKLEATHANPGAAHKNEYRSWRVFVMDEWKPEHFPTDNIRSLEIVLSLRQATFPRICWHSTQTEDLKGVQRALIRKHIPTIWTVPVVYLYCEYYRVISSMEGWDLMVNATHLVCIRIGNRFTQRAKIMNHIVVCKCKNITLLSCTA